MPRASPVELSVTFPPLPSQNSGIMVYSKHNAGGQSGTKRVHVGSCIVELSLIPPVRELEQRDYDLYHP
jgi:hypothetical protein